MNVIRESGGHQLNTLQILKNQKNKNEDEDEEMKEEVY